MNQGTRVTCDLPVTENLALGVNSTLNLSATGPGARYLARALACSAGLRAAIPTNHGEMNRE